MYDLALKNGFIVNENEIYLGIIKYIFSLYKK